MRGDLFLSDTEHADWADVGSSWVPQFTKLSGDFVARIQLLVPQPKNSESCQIRLEVKNSDNSTPNLTADSDGSNGVSISTNGSTKVLIGISGTGTANTSVKLLTICYYASNKVSAVLSDCTTGDDWYVYVDKRNKGQLSQGKLTVSSLASGPHSIFLAKGNVSAENEITNPNSQGWSQCISWLGGLHINKNGSDVNWETQYQYSNESRFSSSSVKWPIKGQFDGRGQFNLASASDVYVRLQNGVITLSTTPPADITYTGNEFMFMSKRQQHTDGNKFDFTADGAHLFVYFWNSETSANAWSDEAFMWDSGDNVLAAKVPAGTWTNCKVVRKNSNDSGKNWNNVWNESHDQTLEDGKNYLRTAEDNVWDVYTPPFYLTGSNALCGAEWGYTGNGTTYNGSATRNNIPADTYQFKLNPTKDYSSDWGHQINSDHIASSGSNVTLSSVNDKQIQFTLSEASDVTIAYDGYGVTVNATPYAPPAVTRTVTIHPNNGESTFTMNVADGGTISSIAATYGNGTASWYKDEELTQAFTLNSSTVTEDMDLFAKWGVSGTFHLAGHLWMANTNGDWDNNKAQTMTNTNGVHTVEYTAPKGWNPFEILNNRNWNYVKTSAYLDTQNSTSGIQLQEKSGHLAFYLESAKRVRITYNGKVRVEILGDPTLDTEVSWGVKTSDSGWGLVPYSWDHSNVMTITDGIASRIIRNVPGNTDHSFSITRGSNEQDKVGRYNFNALYLDTSDPSSGLTWQTMTARLDASDNFNISLAQTDNEWRNCKFRLSEQSDLRITFNGGSIRCDILPKYTVSFNSNGGSEVASQTLFEGLTAVKPDDPTKDGYEFDGWRIGSVEGDEYDFDSPVTANVSLVAKWNQIITHIVTFNTGGGSTIDPVQVVEGNTVVQPADPTWANYTFDGWTLNEEAYDFSTPVMSDIILVADWTYAPAHISSVSINESSIYTWVGDATTYTLVPTLVPGDIASVTVSWSSSDNNVATVENGVITPVGAGTATTATITCTATDYYSGSKTATCAVKVAPCAKAIGSTPSYSVTITGYNSYEDGDATLTGLWNPNTDNGVMTQNARLVRIAFRDLATEYMTEDADGKVAGRAGISDDSDKWMYYSAGTGLFYLQNYKTGHYLYKDKSTGLMGQNGEWKFYGTRAAAYADADTYRWLENGSGDNLRICNKDGYNGSLNGSHTLRRYYVNTVDNWNSPYVRCGLGGHQGNNPIKAIITEVSASVANPFFVASQMNSSYYRMKENATVQANLSSALAEADVISVELYADSATSVTLCKTNGDVVATINLNADAATEYSYMVTAGTMLDGESAFIIKAADNHAGIRSIAVTPMVTADPAQPDLHWTTTPVSAHLLLDGNFTYAATSNDSQGAISYASENAGIAQVNALTGEVTPNGAGTTNITATIAADECHSAYSISYEVSFLGLQDYINTDGVNSVTLPGDYTSENIVINKPFTIDGNGHEIGNLTVQTAGDLTLSGALTVNDFNIFAKAGNTTTPAASGQVRNATNLTANGNAYFYYTVDPSGTVHFGWYDFTVPFRVNVMTGIAGIQDEVLNVDFVNERDYAVMEHLGDKQAAGEYPYKKFRNVMQPNRLYSITLDASHNYNTIRFQKTNDGALVAGDAVTLNAYAGDETHQNWNGVGNGTLHHADAGLSVSTIQVYQSGEKRFLAVNPTEYSLVVGSAFMVQQTGTMTLNQATHDALLAPRRAASAQQPTAIQIASEGKPLSDQLFISADELAGQGYTQGVDVAKAGNIGNVNVPQIWTNAYDSKLCAHEAQLINGQAAYALSLYAPANGTYTLTSKNIPEGYTLYLTQNDSKIWDMSDAYVIDLTKGTTNEYGLLLVERYNAPTGIENIGGNADETIKIVRNGVLYIIRNGEVYDAQGARVK